MYAAMSFCLVVVTVGNDYNVSRLLESVRRTAEFPLRIIVVDNGSEPSSAVQRACDGIARYYWHGGGISVSSARNAGLQLAGDSDLVFFLDDDNEVESGWQRAVVDTFATQAIVGAVAPVILRGNSGEIWCAGVSRSRWSGRTRFRTEVPLGPPGYDGWDTMDLPDACVVRTGLIQAIGGYDEGRFPMHREEADLTCRILEHGWSVRVAREFRVRHFIEQTPTVKAELQRIVGKDGLERVELWSRSRALFHRRHSFGIERLATLCVGLPSWFAVVVWGIASSRNLPRFSVLVAVMRGLARGCREDCS